MNKNKVKDCLIGLIITAVLVMVDQYTKFLAVAHLKNGNPIVIIKNVLEFSYLENRGAAFGIFQGKKVFLLGFTFIVILVIIYFYTRIPSQKRFMFLHLAVTFLIAGALGNFIDRVRLNYVVDFIYFKLIDFPVFNVADIYVTCSAVTIALLLIFYYKEEDMEEIFPERKST